MARRRNRDKQAVNLRRTAEKLLINQLKSAALANVVKSLSTHHDQVERGSSSQAASMDSSMGDFTRPAARRRKNKARAEGDVVDGDDTRSRGGSAADLRSSDEEEATRVNDAQGPATPMETVKAGKRDKGKGKLVEPDDDEVVWEDAESTDATAANDDQSTSNQPFPIGGKVIGQSDRTSAFAGLSSELAAHLQGLEGQGEGLDFSIDLPANGDMELDMDVFRQLPPDMQFELATQMKIRYRFESRSRFQTAKNPDDFSDLQVQAFLRSSKINRTVNSAKVAVSNAASTQVLEGVPSMRIASDETREYVLIKGPMAEPSALALQQRRKEATALSQSFASLPAPTPMSLTSSHGPIPEVKDEPTSANSSYKALGLNSGLSLHDILPGAKSNKNQLAALVTKTKSAAPDTEEVDIVDDDAIDWVDEEEINNDQSWSHSPPPSRKPPSPLPPLTITELNDDDDVITAPTTTRPVIGLELRISLDEEPMDSDPLFSSLAPSSHRDNVVVHDPPPSRSRHEHRERDTEEDRDLQKAIQLSLRNDKAPPTNRSHRSVSQFEDKEDDGEGDELVDRRKRVQERLNKSVVETVSKSSDADADAVAEADAREQKEDSMMKFEYSSRPISEPQQSNPLASLNATLTPIHPKSLSLPPDTPANASSTSLQSSHPSSLLPPTNTSLTSSHPNPLSPSSEPTKTSSSSSLIQMPKSDSTPPPPLPPLKPSMPLLAALPFSRPFRLKSHTSLHPSASASSDAAALPQHPSTTTDKHVFSTPTPPEEANLHNSTVPGYTNTHSIPSRSTSPPVSKEDLQLENISLRNDLLKEDTSLRDSATTKEEEKSGGSKAKGVDSDDVKDKVVVGVIRNEKGIDRHSSVHTEHAKNDRGVSQAGTG
eukprot:CAMPEP_0184666096 /NCGR_PEP_ID=MMETSP0308-20130426/60039_1 /TAXON_ID=38269 /ORGANISM="Gloeochaete witrockiana, Strain SAG 46.84" /LENGTH=883 /DNA_ID=CAMNT_0027110515 /DNA_START=98 /DNA_END=2745 /DNA_ORIENTATION=-